MINGTFLSTAHTQLSKVLASFEGNSYIACSKHGIKLKWKISWMSSDDYAIIVFLLSIANFRFLSVYVYPILKTSNIIKA